jgi:hypothetical protein
MANTSIFNAFERMWQHIVAALGNKSDLDHTHTPEEIGALTPSVFSYDEDTHTLYINT